MFASPNRNFSDKIKYGDIDWKNRAKALEAVRLRFQEWYVGPMNALEGVNGSGFVEVALCCVLVDTLSQYIFDLNESDGTKFQKVLDENIAEIRAIARLSIDTGTEFKGKKVILKSGSEIVWKSFRCGILHEANAMMCCGIDGGAPIFRIEADQTFDNQGKSISSFVISPSLFRGKVTQIFSEYFDALRDGLGYCGLAANDLKANFEKKFERSFGFRLP